MLSGGDTLLKRVAMMLWVVILMTGWAAATGSLAAAGAPQAYVGLFKDDAVAVLDTAQNKVVGTIAVPKGPHGLVVTPDGRKVYVSSDGASTVSVIDTATDRVVGASRWAQIPMALRSRATGAECSSRAGVRIARWSSTRQRIA
jgi:YVTN family beta-propeller protein